MSAAKNTTPASVTCPKCGGGQKIAQFKHVENGVCFLCNGAGVTDAVTAAGWERATMGAAARDSFKGATVAAATPNLKSKIIRLGLDFLTGEQRVERYEDGMFALACSVLDGENSGEYRLYFNVTGGQVQIVKDMMQAGMRPYYKQIAAALQGALKR